MNFGLKTRIQKIIAFVLVMAMSIGLFQISGMEAYAYTAQTGMIVSTDQGLVETFYEASPNGTHARNFEYGKPVTVINEVKGTDGALWYQISYTLKAGGEETSYCPAANVLLDKNVTVLGQGVINTNEVSLRNQAGTDKTVIIATLNNGHKLEILDSTSVNGSTWYRVRTVVNGTTMLGWVFGSYVTETIPDIEVDEEYEDYLVRIGFPESYVHSLAILHAQYPNWVFEPVKTGLTWAEVIENESKPGRALIQTHRDDALKSYADTEYNWYTNEWVIRDSSSWVSAHTDYIAYCMDPRNWFNATNIFMFESLSYSQSHNIAGVNAIISGTFMTKEIENGDGTMLNYANTFMEIGKSLNVSPYHLASRVRQEQGVNGTSPLISGTYAGYEGYYNYFNHGAYGTGNTVYTNGLTFAKNNGWNTRYKSLYGGAERIAKNYISVGQDTLYFQKFDVIAQGGLYNHQYMTNIEAAISESKSVAKAYTDKQQAFTFKIPVYENMPSEPVTFTATGNRNNYLKSLTIEGYSLTPSFDGAKTSYSLIVDNNVTSIKVAATPVVSKASVQGTGTLTLKEGVNTFSIICKSESGDKKTYTLTVTREGSGQTPPSGGGTSAYSYSSDKYVVGTYVTGVEPQTKASDLLTGFQASGCALKVLTAAGEENTGAVATGNKLGVYVDGKLVETKEIVIYGDVNGDGKVNVLDAIIINRYTISLSEINGVCMTGADVNRDGKVNVLDAIIINRYTIGLSSIAQK